MNPFVKRIEKARLYLDRTGFDCFITKNSSNIFYLTGLYNAEGYLCVTHRNITFFTGGIYYQYAVDKQKELQTQFQIEKIEKKNFYKFLRVHKKPVVFSNEISFQGWEKLSRETNGKLKTTADFVAKMRATKEPNEIVRIKKALVIAKKVLKKIRPLIKPGISELDIAAEISCQIRTLGGDKEAFQTIVASGINSSYPHHIPSRRKFEKNDIVLIDMGVSVAGYNSDITETFVIGRISDEALKVINPIKEVHKKISSTLKGGEKSCKKLHLYAVEIFKNYGLEKFFVHGLGHGVGIDVHELPVLNSSSKDRIEKSMVFTVEPAIYLPGKFGVRIEKMHFA
ncbi:MAG: aminopeptidase P family protein [bacterium]|nr:aminopeptidase P family protein [bacterium]